ncbi:MAG: magnesium transporter CorA family protein [Nocardioidaceae bacterium]
MGSTRSRVWRDGQVAAQDIQLEELSRYLDQDGQLVWFDLCDPDQDQLGDLAAELALDPLAVEDAVAHLERTKAVRYSHYTFLKAYATQVTSADSGATNADKGRVSIGSHLYVEPVSAFVMRTGVVTVRHAGRFDMSDVVARWDDNAEMLKYGVGSLVHDLLDVIVDGHFDTVQALDDVMEGLEDILFDLKVNTAEVQRRTYQVRKDLVRLRRVVLPMRDLVSTIRHSGEQTGAPAELDAPYADLYDHVLRVTEWTTSLQDMVTTIFETNLSLQDARLNTVMKKLTSWAAIIAVPTAITGYFGQNLPYPGFGQESGFIASIVLIVGIAGALYLLFRRKDWL